MNNHQQSCFSSIASDFLHQASAVTKSRCSTTAAKTEFLNWGSEKLIHVNTTGDGCQFASVSLGKGPFLSTD